MWFRGLFLIISATACASVVAFEQANAFSSVRQDKPTSKIEEADKPILAAGKRCSSKKLTKMWM